VINFLYTYPFFSKQDGEVMAENMMKRLKGALE